MASQWLSLFRRRPAGADGAAQERPELQAILATLRGVLAEVSGGAFAPSDVLDDVDLYDAGYVDSIAVTEFVVRVASEYDIPLFDSRVGTEFKSIQDVARHVNSELMRRAGVGAEPR